ncbi:carboxypeptidase regulatory-like domain-containing protein [Chondromyces crocatus]|uniref:Carboxyl-terminal processing protease n=1 Tax=Chondromyces crocatus TaxID=52 RepID=A0A0K1E6D3_CHOCO|nr:carboxypeptidase regulatory-like domain-containing protein [Chondromyces crocatus]AKT36242.1 carboxyl-terminal processing protease [Chondromyces crocatus]
MERDRQGTWGTAALLSLALLTLPLIVWLILPKPAAPSRSAPPMTRTSVEVASPPAPPEPVLAAQHDEVEAPVEAERTVPVRGTVLDPEGNPMTAAVVSCEEPRASAATDGEGRFELPPEAEGCLAMAVHALHQPSEKTQLHAGRENTLRLMAGGVIEGAVLDEQGRPVTSYQLAVEAFVPSLDPEARYGNRSRRVSDPEGLFRMDRLPPGRYVLAASAEGRPPARSEGIEVERGRTTAHVRITLAQGATLRGRVTDAETQAPIGEAQVQLDAVTSSGPSAIPAVKTDDAGRFEITGVPRQGPFSVRVQHADYMAKIVPGLDARGGGSTEVDVGLRRRVEGGANEEFTGIGATLLPGPEGVKVMGVIEGGPAERAGLLAGDRLVRIDGVDATGMTLSDCVQRLRGASGTRVSLSVDREGRPVDLTVLREVVVR